MQSGNSLGDQATGFYFLAALDIDTIFCHLFHLEKLPKDRSKYFVIFRLIPDFGWSLRKFSG